MTVDNKLITFHCSPISIRNEYQHDIVSALQMCHHSIHNST